MELYQLKTFLAVAEEGHLTRAAERLFISQPAVSAHIKALEELLGLKLFNRTNKGVQLNEAGQVLQKEARKVLSAVDGLRNKAYELRGEYAGSVHIGLNTAASFLRITPLVTRLKRKHPKVEFELSKASSGNIISKLKNNQLDIGFVFDQWDSKQLSFVELASTHLHVAAPKSWQDKIDGADWETLVKLPWILSPRGNPIRRLMDRTFSQIGVKPEEVMTVDETALIAELVAAGDGIAMLKYEDIQSYVDAGEICQWDGEPVEITLFLAFQKDRKDDSLIKTVLREAREVWNLPRDGKS